LPVFARLSPRLVGSFVSQRAVGPGGDSGECSK